MYFMESATELHHSLKQNPTTMSKLLSLLAFGLFSWLATGATQERTITGSVTNSQDGSPIPGVSVTLKGTTTSTITNNQGKYAITVPDEKAVLVFSFIGYDTQEITVKQQHLIDVKLK